MNLQETIRNRWLVVFAAVLVVVAILLPASATLAQSGGGYHLKTVAAPQKSHVSSGGRYNLAWIETQTSLLWSSGAGFRLDPLAPVDSLQYGYGVCLPIIMKDYQ